MSYSFLMQIENSSNHRSENWFCFPFLQFTWRFVTNVLFKRISSSVFHYQIDLYKSKNTVFRVYMISYNLIMQGWSKLPNISTYLSILLRSSDDNCLFSYILTAIFLCLPKSTPHFTSAWAPLPNYLWNWIPENNFYVNFLYF